MRVAVIGGGVIGLAVSWRLAADGERVDLFDDRTGRGASFAAAGMLAPAGEAWFGEDALVRAGVESARMWPEFAARLGHASDVDVWLRREPSLMVGADAADAADLDRVHRIVQGLGLAAERLTRREARRLEPALTSTLRRALLLRGDLSVHNRRVVEALLRAGARAGVRMHPERADVVTDPAGIAVGVRSRHAGTVTRADAVVVTAGHDSRGVGGLPELLRRAVRPVKGQILRLRAAGPLVSRTVRARVRGDAVYVVPRADREIVVGATSEESEDLRVTAEGVFEVLRCGIELLPALRDCEVAEVAARARPGTVDNFPLVGRTQVPNLLVATGHHRGGVLLAPLTAAAVSALLHGAPVLETVLPFDPARLTERRDPGHGCLPGALLDASVSAAGGRS